MVVNDFHVCNTTETVSKFYSLGFISMALGQGLYLCVFLKDFVSVLTTTVQSI